MKHLCLVLSLIILLSLFSGCIDHQGERPFDYPPARWISETPDFWFDIPPYIDQTVKLEFEGQVQLSEQTIKVMVWFDYTDGIHVYKKSNASEGNFGGTCQFFPDKLIVTVDKENDTLFNGQYDTITFIRNASDEATSSQAP